MHLHSLTALPISLPQNSGEQCVNAWGRMKELRHILSRVSGASPKCKTTALRIRRVDKESRHKPNLNTVGFHFQTLGKQKKKMRETVQTMSFHRIEGNCPPQTDKSTAGQTEIS